MYDGIYSAKKRKINEITSFPATWMELEIIRLSPKTKERERQISCDITYIWNLKYDTSRAIFEILPMKQKQIHRHREQTCIPQGGD